MRRLKILQLFSRYEQYGGEERIVSQMSDSLQEICDVQNLVTSSAEMMRQSFAQKAMLPLSLFHNAEIARKLQCCQDAGQFDAWMVHNVFPAMSPVVYQKAFAWGIPVIQYLHNYRFGCANGFFLDHGQPCQRCMHGNFWHAFLRKTWRDNRLASGAMGAVLSYTRYLAVFEKVSQWIAVSQRQKSLHVEMGVPSERIRVIPHFYAKPVRPVKYPANGYALFIGRLSVEKGVMQLLEAWKKLHPQDRELVIAGQGPEKARLEEYVAYHSLTNVRFTGFVSEDAQDELWAGAAFSVVPSIWEEPFGMVVLEAWAHSRPVVAHAIGALPELVTHRHTGLLAKPWDTEALASTLLEAFQSRDLCSEMGANGMRLLSARFNQAEWLESIRDVYRTLNL